MRCERPAFRYESIFIGANFQSTLKEPGYFTFDALQIADFALPYDKSLPTELAQNCDVLSVSFSIFRQFCFPIVSSRCRHRCLAAGSMPMPETSVHEDNFAQRGKY